MHTIPLSMVEQWVREYKAGHTLKSLAEAYNIDVTVIKRRIKKFGVKLRTGAEVQKLLDKKELVKIALVARIKLGQILVLTKEQIELYNKGASATDISKLTGWSQTSVLRALKRQRVKVRTPKEFKPYVQPKLTASNNKYWSNQENRIKQSIAQQRRFNNTVTRETWDGFATIKHGNEQLSYDWSNWRKLVFSRDNYTCRVCNSISKKSSPLEPHHIIPRYKDRGRTYDVNNGITLCRSCHLVTMTKEHLFEPYFFSLIDQINKGIKPTTSKEEFLNILKNPIA